MAGKHARNTTRRGGVKRSAPYAWLGAGAVGLGIGAAAFACGAGVAAADDGGESPSSSAGSSAASGGAGAEDSGSRQSASDTTTAKRTRKNDSPETTSQEEKTASQSADTPTVDHETAHAQNKQRTHRTVSQPLVAHSNEDAPAIDSSEVSDVTAGIPGETSAEPSAAGSADETPAAAQEHESLPIAQLEFPAPLVAARSSEPKTQESSAAALATALPRAAVDTPVITYTVGKEYFDWRSEHSSYVQPTPATYVHTPGLNDPLGVGSVPGFVETYDIQTGNSTYTITGQQSTVICWGCNTSDSGSPNLVPVDIYIVETLDTDPSDISINFHIQRIYRAQVGRTYVDSFSPNYESNVILHLIGIPVGTRLANSADDDGDNIPDDQDPDDDGDNIPDDEDPDDDGDDTPDDEEPDDDGDGIPNDEDPDDDDDGDGDGDGDDDGDGVSNIDDFEIGFPASLFYTEPDEDNPAWEANFENLMQNISFIPVFGNIGAGLVSTLVDGGQFLGSFAASLTTGQWSNTIDEFSDLGGSVAMIFIPAVGKPIGKIALKSVGTGIENFFNLFGGGDDDRRARNRGSFMSDGQQFVWYLEPTKVTV